MININTVQDAWTTNQINKCNEKQSLPNQALRRLMETPASFSVNQTESTEMYAPSEYAEGSRKNTECLESVNVLLRCVFGCEQPHPQHFVQRTQSQPAPGVGR